jgi:NAD(P)-dependent dehydrogenase (short-subunit alcohol dehydrogenase family)
LIFVGFARIRNALRSEAELSNNSCAGWPVALASGEIARRYVDSDDLSPDGQEQNMFAGRIASGRIGDPDEIGKAAVFSASDATIFVNGTELFVDGGGAQI